MTVGIGAAVGIVAGLLAPLSANAFVGAEFRPGMIISDAEFYDWSSMSTGQIQTFLNERGRSCTPSGGVPCLKDYRDSIPAKPNDPYRCYAIPGGTNVTAADMIQRVAQNCGINPKVLLVLLEKEQGIVSSSGPSSRMYRSATGYGCPDTADCDAAYYGFYNQVYRAAWQFRVYAQNPNGNYGVGRVSSIGYHPDTFSTGRCGSQAVFVENMATSSLYRYTPYVPNQAALNNLYGTGDTCSAYGNRNFWRLYNDWFHPTFQWWEVVAGRNAAWEAQGGAQGPIGTSVQVPVCSAGGCYENFTNGTIYAPVGGSYAVIGGAATKFGQMGGPISKIGRPVANTTDDGAGGRVTRFEAGIIVESRGGTFAIPGGHGGLYLQVGGATSKFGWPVSDEVPDGLGGSTVRLSGGILTWSPATGNRILPGGHAQNFVNRGGPAHKLGSPTSNEIEDGRGGSYVTFQGGASFWSSATGTRWVPGGLAQRYLAIGGPASKLGYPVSDEIEDGRGGSYVRFQNGIMVWSPSTGVSVLPGGHASTYLARGGASSKLGYPTSSEIADDRGGSYVQFQGGVSVWGPSTGTYALPGGLGKAFVDSLAGEFKLGYPVSNEIEDGRGGSYVRYARGLTAWSSAGGTRSLPGTFATVYLASLAGDFKLGYPTSNEAADGPAGSRITFQRGGVVWSNAGTFSLPGGHWAVYVREGGGAGTLGYPVSGETATPTGSRVIYQRGQTNWSSTTGATTLG